MASERSTRIGSTVAGYRLESLLGRGGMSVVYLAEHVHLGRKVALKLLAHDLADDESYRERFEREWHRAAAIDHPNVIPIYDAGKADGQLYIAMRYVEGCDLRTTLRRDGPLGLGRTLFILEQAASALDAAHDHDLVHRDVKPANILIEEPSERVFVTDFGVAKQTTSRGMTRTGVFVGSVDYAAPEQIEGLPVDARTDVYALGCVLYECLVGETPFEREGEVAVMHAHLSDPPPTVSAARPDLPKALDRVIATAMAKARDDRYASCEELVRAGRAAVLGQPSTLTPRSVEPAPAPATVRQEIAAPPPTATASSDAAVPATSPESAPAVPPEALEPSPPPPPPAPPPARPAKGGARRWIATALAAAVAAVAAGLVVFFVTRGDSETSSSPGAAAATEQAPTEAPATEAQPGTTAETTAETRAEPESELAALVPAELWQDCTEQAPTRAGAIAAAVCTPSAEAGAGGPDQWELSAFPDAASLASTYEAIREERGLDADSGRCNGVSWGGEGGWNHGPDKPGGSRLCYFDDDGGAVIVWTHDKLGQPNHRDMLAVAKVGDVDHAGLFNWWRFWVHRIGKID